MLKLGYEDRHMEIREKIVDYMKQKRKEFSLLFESDEAFDDYLDEMSQNGTWGGSSSMKFYTKFNLHHNSF